MLKPNTNRNSILLAIMLLLILGATGLAAPSSQPAAFTSGTDSVRDQLLARALPLFKEAGLNLNPFDFERAVATPDGKALFAPVREGEAIEAQVRQFKRNRRRQLLAGVLYARRAFEFQGQSYGPGIHRVVLENRDAGLPESTPDAPVYQQTCESQQSGSCRIKAEYTEQTVTIGCQTEGPAKCNLSGGGGGGGDTGDPGDGGSSGQGELCAFMTAASAFSRFFGPGTAVAGLLATGIAYLRTRSLWWPIGLHFGRNLVWTYASYWGWASAPTGTNLWQTELLNDGNLIYTLTAIAMLIAVAGLPIRPHPRDKALADKYVHHGLWPPWQTHSAGSGKEERARRLEF